MTDIVEQDKCICVRVREMDSARACVGVVCSRASNWRAHERVKRARVRDEACEWAFLRASSRDSEEDKCFEIKIKSC